jgi:hypothetical protein
MAQKPWVVPIPEQLKWLIYRKISEAADFEFSPQELSSFTDAISAITIVGDRYPTPQTK